MPWAGALQPTESLSGEENERTRRYSEVRKVLPTVYDSEGEGNITGFQFFVLESEGSNNPKVAFDSLYTDSAANILCRRVQTEIFG